MTKSSESHQWRKVRNRMRDEFRESYRSYAKHNSCPFTFFQSIDRYIIDLQYCLCLQPNEVCFDSHDYLETLAAESEMYNI